MTATRSRTLDPGTSHEPHQQLDLGRLRQTGDLGGDGVGQAGVAVGRADPDHGTPGRSSARSSRCLAHQGPRELRWADAAHRAHRHTRLDHRGGEVIGITGDTADADSGASHAPRVSRPGAMRGLPVSRTSRPTARPAPCSATERLNPRRGA